MFVCRRAYVRSSSRHRCDKLSGSNVPIADNQPSFLQSGRGVNLSGMGASYGGFFAPKIAAICARCVALSTLTRAASAFDYKNISMTLIVRMTRAA